MTEQDAKAAMAVAEETQAKLDVEKTAREAAEKAALEAKAKADAAEAKLAAIEAGARSTRFTALAAALKLPKDAGAILDAAEKALGSDGFGKLEGFMKGLAAQVDETKLFGEIGASGAEGSAEPSRKLAAIAEGLVKAGKAKTHADAMTIAATENPDLYRLHVEEQRKGAR